METTDTKAIVLTCYYRPKPGGLCKRLFRAIESLLAAGHDVHYLAIERFPIDHPNCYFHRFPWPAFMRTHLAFWGVFHLLAPFILLYIGFRHHVSHAFAFSSTYSLFLQPVRLARNIPLTLFLRGDILEGHRTSNKHNWLIQLETVIEGLAIAGVRLYGVTKTLTDKVIARHRILHSSYYDVMRNDIATPTNRDRTPKKPGDSLRLGCAGVLDNGKNLPLILQCINRLKDRRLHLYIYGIGPAEQALKDTAHRLGISGKVTFVGWVSVPSQIWENIDLLLLPSLHEGAPNSVLEAIGNGVPVLASDIPELREILPSTSLIEVSSLDSWAHALNLILANPAGATQKLALDQSNYTQTLRFNWDSQIRELILKQ